MPVYLLFYLQPAAVYLGNRILAESRNDNSCPARDPRSRAEKKRLYTGILLAAATVQARNWMWKYTTLALAASTVLLRDSNSRPQ